MNNMLTPFEKRRKVIIYDGKLIKHKKNLESVQDLILKK